MKRFLMTTATALVLGTAAYADAHSSTFSEMVYDAETNLNASELIGMRVYATEADTNDMMSVAEGGEQEWDDIGEINEIVLTRDGSVQAVIVGVGGFLGMGERNVAVDMSQIRFVAEDGGGDDFFLVVSAAAADIEVAPAYERSGMAMGDGTTETDTEMTAVEMRDGDDRMMLTPPMIERDGYETVSRDDLTTEDLTGARVYGPNDEDVGEISELLLNDDGTMDRAVLSIGGFFGLGEHSIALSFDELQIVRDAGGDVRVYVDSTQETLEQQPEYEG